MSYATALIWLAGASGLLYYVSTSDQFKVSTVFVAGNALVPASELEAAAAVRGANIFWIRHEEVARRVQGVPAVRTAQAAIRLPSRVDVRVTERTPRALWATPGGSRLVDADGQLLGPPTDRTDLPMIYDRSGEGPRERVDADAIETMMQLKAALPRLERAAVREFEYTADGVTALLDSGLSVKFGGSRELAWKLEAFSAIRREIERTAQRAELIDVRFRDRAYFR
ncbi:MAG: cell division protein FtsQ/DivIB [Chloroflexota bacterium]